MEIACGSLTDWNASWERGWGQREREVWPSVSASSVSPQRLTFLPLNRALLLRSRQPRLGESLGRTPTLHPSLCHPSGRYGDPHLPSVCLALLLCVCGTFPRTVVFQRVSHLPLQGSSFSSFPVGLRGRHGAQTLASSLSLSGSTSLSQLQALVPSTSKDK